jgi:hypothetical protein
MPVVMVSNKHRISAPAVLILNYKKIKVDAHLLTQQQQSINYNQFILNSVQCLTWPVSLHALIQNTSGGHSNSHHM